MITKAKLFSKTWGEVKSFFDTLNYCIKLSWKASKFYTFVRLAAQVFMSVSSILAAFLVRTVIDLLALNSGEDIETLKFKVVLFVSLTLLLTLATLLVRKINEYSSNIHDDILRNYMSMEILSKSLGADVEQYDSPEFYNAIEQSRTDSYSMIYIVWNALSIIGAVITLTSAAVIICKLNLLFGGLVLVTAIPSAIVELKYTERLYQWGKAHVSEQRKMGYFTRIASSREYAMDVRLYSLGGYLKSKYSGLWENYFSKRRKLVKKQTSWVIPISFLPEIAISFILVSIAMNILDGRNTIGDYSLYSGLLAQLSGSILGVVYAVSRIYEDRLKIANYRKLKNFSANISSESGKNKLSEAMEIEFRNVSFKYPGTDKLVLKNLNFKINKQEKVCIVGVNGTGKSTIIKLLLRFYDVTDGEILFNGINIREYDLSSLRRGFSVFFQDAVSYSMTFRENIMLSDLENYQNDEQISLALEKSGGLSMTEKLPDGLDTYITKLFSESGVELSGGQNQKIALARTFYRRSFALLLDEPSSSLDPEAEHLLFQQLESFSEGKTTIFTSHRLSNVHLADRVIVIENGTVLEQGTHKELMNNSQRYAELYNYQAEKFANN